MSVDELRLKGSGELVCFKKKKKKKIAPRWESDR